MKKWKWKIKMLGLMGGALDRHPKRTMWTHVICLEGINEVNHASLLCIRMLGTFNQQVPMILSNNYWCQSKTRSLLDTGMDVFP